MMCECGSVSYTDHILPVVTLLKSGHWTEKKKILLEYEPYDTERKITKKKAMTTAFTSEFDCAQFTVGQYLYSWKVLIFIPTSFHQSSLHLNINKASWIESRISLLWEKTRIFKKKCLRKLFYPNGTTLQLSYRVQLQVFEFRELGEVLHLGDIWGRDLKKPFN